MIGIVPAPMMMTFILISLEPIAGLSAIIEMLSNAGFNARCAVIRSLQEVLVSIDRQLGAAERVAGGPTACRPLLPVRGECMPDWLCRSV
jgi:hypothetical protein